MEETSQPRSRRHLLFGGLAAAAGVALSRFAHPEPAAAANGDPILAGNANTASGETSLLTGGGSAFVASSIAHDQVGVAGGSGTDVVPVDGAAAGVYGYGEASGTVGVLGEAVNDLGAGVVGFGPWGVYGTGGVGVAGDVGTGATGVYGFVGDGAAPVPTANVAVEARAETSSLFALNVIGRASFSRSGRITVVAGRSSVTINMSRISSSSLIIAVPQTYQPGVWLIAATPGTNLFTVRLNKAVTSNFVVAFLVLN